MSSFAWRVLRPKTEGGESLKLIWKLAAVLALVTLGMTAAYFVAAPVGAAPGGGGGGNCVSGGTKIDVSMESYTIVAPAGTVVTAVYIKAGNVCIPVTSDSNDGCYSVSGLGTPTVMVTRVGSGSECKEISHIEYVTGPGTTPPTTTTTTTTTPTQPTTTISTTTTP
jgi:hypothetical protein